MNTNNILYIGNFTKSYSAAQAMIYSILHQNINSSLISAFQNPMIKDMFYNYFMEYTSQLSFVAGSSIKDITERAIHKYEWYCFLSNDCMYHKGYTAELLEIISKSPDTPEFLVLPQNSNELDYAAILMNRSKILTEIQNNSDINLTISNRIKDTIIKASKSFQSVLINYEIDNNSVLYEDSQSLFGKFMGTSELLDSMVYINKNNYRVYNITNNIIGYMVEKTGDIIRIEWHTNNKENPTVSATYIIDHFQRVYRAF